MRPSLARVIILVMTSLGLTGGHALAAPMADRDDQALKAFRFDRIDADVKTLPPGPQRDYFAGMAANAEGRLEDSVKLLTDALPALRASRPDRAAQALDTLADNYTKLFRYADAEASYQDLQAHFSSQLSPTELKGAKNDGQLSHVLSGAPAQTITFDGPVDIKTVRNPLGSLNADLTVNAVTGPWLLDTGANMSVITESFAKKLGLTPLSGVAQTQAGMTGIENPMHVAIIPTLPIGGATVHNVVALVLPDDNLKVQYDKAGNRYQINAIIGYPVFQALGRVTFRRDGEVLAGDAASPSVGGARMYMKALAPIIFCKVAGQDLPFSFDTGAFSTDLLLAYYERFKAQAPKWKRVDSLSSGAGGVVKQKVYVQETVTFQAGDRSVVLHHVTIHSTGTGSDNDDLYGNLGEDFVAGFDSFTLDFTAMRLSLGRPLAPEPTKP